jgi:hypothetical protein
LLTKRGAGIVLIPAAGTLLVSAATVIVATNTLAVALIAGPVPPAPPGS